jgi:hypothetical protein
MYLLSRINSNPPWASDPVTALPVKCAPPTAAFPPSHPLAPYGDARTKVVDGTKPTRRTKQSQQANDDIVNDPIRMITNHQIRVKKCGFLMRMLFLEGKN